MQEFYDTKASRGISPERIRTIASLISHYVRQQNLDQVSILDVGCGDGKTTRGIIDQLGTTGGLKPHKMRVHGWDLSPVCLLEAQKLGIETEVRDVSQPDNRSGSQEHLDVVIFSEVLEHLVDTGCAIQNIRKVLKTGGALVLTTPNLAAWYNRILLFIGNQPHMTEVSFENHRFGNRFFEKLLGEAPGTAGMAGHLRVFTYKALIEFLRHFDFEIVKVTGIASHGDMLSRTIARIWTGGAGDVAVLAIKRDRFS